MERRRYLIVNADDFGQSLGVNRGVMQAHEHGIVTSASLMVRWPAADHAAAYAGAHPDLSLGLHLDLGEWAFRGRWVPIYQVVSNDDASAVSREVERQLTLFRRLTNRDPTHLDSHQHVHRRDPVRAILLGLASRLSIPLRENDPAIRYRGDFYGQTGTGESLPDRVSVEALIGILATLESGVSELGCHPGEVDGLESMYRTERPEEVRVLCDPSIRLALDAHQVVLCSFSDRARARDGDEASHAAASTAMQRSSWE